jgi:hypothetical protein
MAKFYLPLCLFNRHWPRRDLAKWDGYNYTSSCTICRSKIRRRSSGVWLRDWMKFEHEPGAADKI